MSENVNFEEQTEFKALVDFIVAHPHDAHTADEECLVNNIKRTML